MELNSNMASLELNEESISTVSIDNSGLPNSISKQDLRRSTRIKKQINLSVGAAHTHRKKIDKGDSKSKIEQYYLSKQVRRLPSTLETIYEEPKSSNNEVQYMSVKKFKRVLNFDEENFVLHKNKRSKKRLMKAKKVTASNRISTRKKVSMEALLRKLEAVEEENKESSTRIE